MERTNHSDHSQLPDQIRVPVKVCESQFQQLFQSAPLLSLHARFAFETLGKIGEGGMGSVYQVKDHRINRIAALKLLSDKNATEHARLRFLREAEITARLDHPAIPPVYETGLTADGDLYLLMRMIRGKTLREVIKDCHDLRALERRDLVEIMVKVAEAVAYAHSQGIVHRDLKPDNIMVGEFGEVLVIDWGIAKDLNEKDERAADQILETQLSKKELEQVGLTVSGAMVGTPGYMAPEQIEGVKIDERADLFALGVILVEALTGKKAIAGKATIDLVVATASGLVMSPRNLDSSLSNDIDWIGRRATEHDREFRTQEVEDLVVQLRAYLNGDEIPDYSYSLLERVQRAIKRRPGFIVSATVGALLFALIGNLWLTLELEGQKREKAEDAAIVAEKRLGTAEDEAEKAKAVLALFNEARNLVERGAPQAKLKEKIEEALESGGRTKNQLLTGARIYSDANFDAANKKLLEEAVEKYPPCYEGLFSLHLWELKSSNREFYLTTSLQRLVDESKKRGQENEYTLFGDALRLDLSERLDESIAAYSKIEEYTTSFSWMYFNRGAVWEQKGELDKALADFNRALEIYPRYAEAYSGRGSIWAKKGQFDKALVEFNRAIEIYPRFMLCYINRGVYWEKIGAVDKALADYSKALEINPLEPRAFLYRGLIWKNKGELNKALADYNAAIKLDPEMGKAFVKRGDLWKKKEEFNKALADYNKALKINPREAAAFTGRGIAWGKRNKLDKALADFDRGIELDPRNALALFNRGVVWSEKGEFSKALADYNRALKVDPKYVDVLTNRGNIWRKSGQLEKAFADHNKALEINPRNEVALTSRGNNWEKLGKLDKALADFNRALKINPRYIDALTNRGVIWAKKGQFDKALSDFNRALDIEPRNTLALMNRGLVWTNKKRNLRALADMTKAIELQHTDPYVYFVRGFLYLSLKNGKEAVTDFETFLRLAPNHSKASEARKLRAQARASQQK